jgi:hypothetical protein
MAAELARGLPAEPSPALPSPAEPSPALPSPAEPPLAGSSPADPAPAEPATDSASAEPGGDPTLTAWAADCAERACTDVSDLLPDDAPLLAIAAARAWSTGAGTADAAREAAYHAQFAARTASDGGHAKVASAIRAAVAAAGSVDDPALAREAATRALEAIAAGSAACELEPNLGAERRRQWKGLPEHRRAAVLGAEPPEPPAAACAL